MVDIKNIKICHFGTEVNQCITWFLVFHFLLLANEKQNELKLSKYKGKCSSVCSIYDLNKALNNRGRAYREREYKSTLENKN